jgi:tetrahydromethanopterin S-methyltransferase subunit G
MESVLALIFSAENMRMLVLLVFGFSCFVWLKMSFEKSIGELRYNDLAVIGKRIDSVEKRIDGVEFSLGKRIDSVEKHIDGVEFSLGKRIDSVEKHIDGVELSLGKRIDDLKYNDFAHLNNTIEALTFTLEKNGYLKREDKEYIDSRLD